MKTRPDENFKLGEREVKILSIKVAEFLEGSTREGKKIEGSSPEEENTSKRWSIHQFIQHLTYYN